jgi:hypothetical protein
VNVCVVCVCSAPNCCDTGAAVRQPAGFRSEWDTLYILDFKLSQRSVTAYEGGTDRVFRNVSI